MAWDTRPIERELENRLKNKGDDLTEIEGIELFSTYVTARKRLVEEILPEIKAIEGSLTDHGERHIANVLDNIYALIGKDSTRISTMELYFLCLIGLFHDVGNIHGRKGHFDKKIIYEIYNYVRSHESRFDDEKNLVAEAASKHSGIASDGTTDTIKELNDSAVGLWNRGINLRKCAAILRFADELAEGRQRTSDFMQLHHKYEPDSEIHHKYSSCSNVFISRDDNRIALTYTIKIATSKLAVWDETEELLKYIYIRVLKLNNERLYNKYYADILSHFKRVEVVLNFEINGVPVTIGLKTLVLTDLVLPGYEVFSDIYKTDMTYEVSKIIDKLKQTVYGTAGVSR